MRFKAIIKAIKNYRKRLNDYYNIIRAKCDISKMRFLVDAFYCHFRYNCCVNDYVKHQFYRLNKIGRKGFITAYPAIEFAQKNNDRDSAEIATDKEKALNTLSAYITRDWCGPKYHNSKEECEQFTKKHSKCIVKPLRLSYGEGIRVADTSEFDVEGGLYNAINKNGDFLVEELIVQCEELSRIHPSSVNTLRITYFDERIVAVSLRMGVGGNSVDNIGSGGLFADVDIESGIVCSAAFDDNMNSYLVHPDTGVIIPGIRIPFWKECVAYSKKVRDVLPGLRLTGLDIAVTDNGPVLVEINSQPDLYMHQNPHNTGIAMLLK